MPPAAADAADGGRRPRLNRDRVLQAAVALADRDGLDAVSMRKLADHLGVVPMALYKHVANKDELLDGMVDVIVGEIDAPAPSERWRTAVRERILSARAGLLRHPWARAALESRAGHTPVVLAHLDDLTGRFLAGGLSADLVHHAMHALGGRVWGFSAEPFDGDRAVGPRPVDPDAQVAALEAAAGSYPHIAEVALVAIRDAGPDAVLGCDEQFEFEFALDLLLEGIERRHEAGWASPRGQARVRGERGR